MRRLITACALLALALYLIFAAPYWLFAAAAVVFGLVCYYEYSGLVAAHGIPRPVAFGIAAGLLILFWPPNLPAIYFLCALTLLAVVAFIMCLRFPDLRDILPRVASGLLGAFYTFAPWRFAIALRKESVHLLFFALALNWAGDSAAYYVGRIIGRHKLAPVISPKKTWEGAVAAVLAALVFGLLYLGHFLPRIPLWEICVIAVVANIGGQFGDLAESAMKRGAGMKDSGAILPGHGGLLDRVDSSLFALPIVYALLLGFRLSP
jgi:phosphatidate cytidylyltransferase